MLVLVITMHPGNQYMIDVSTVYLADENCTMLNPSIVHLVTQISCLRALSLSNKLAQRALLNRTWVVVLLLI